MSDMNQPFNIPEKDLHVVDYVNKNAEVTETESAEMAKLAETEYKDIDSEEAIENNTVAASMESNEIANKEAAAQLIEELKKHETQKAENPTEEAPLEPPEVPTQQDAAQPAQAATQQDPDEKFENEMARLIKQAQMLDKSPLFLKKQNMDKNIMGAPGKLTAGSIPVRTPFNYCINKILEDNNGSLMPRLDSSIEGSDRNVTLDDIRAMNAVTKTYDDKRHVGDTPTPTGPAEAVRGDIPASLFKSIIYTIKCEKTELSIGLIHDDFIGFNLAVDENNFAEIRRDRDTISVDVRKICNHRNVRFTTTISRHRTDPQIRQINAEIDSVIRSIVK